MLTQISPKQLDGLWPQIAELLAPALACNRGEATLSQVRMQLAYGHAHLLAWSESDPLKGGVAVIEFVQHPNRRIAHISYIGGRGIVRAEVFEHVKAWCKQQGASEIRALCDDAHARLFARQGMTDIYRMVGVAL